MFQDFEIVTDPSVGPRRLPELRAVLSKHKLQGFIVPRADAHQGEVVPARDERLAWLTGFTGSAGLAIVLEKAAAVFVDGRYTLQVAEQVDKNSFELLHILHDDPMKWLPDKINKGDRIGYDPMLLTVNEVEEFEKCCKDSSALLVPVEENPIDAIWTDQPEPPLTSVSIRPYELAGESTTDKICRIKDEIGKSSAQTAVLTLPDSIAWLFNIRGADVAHTPLPLSFALVPVDGKCSLFVDERKISDEVRLKLSDIVDVEAPEKLIPTLKNRAARGEAILLDPNTAPEIFAREIEESGGKIVAKQDPVILPKAVKNEIEQKGMREAHIRDGVSYARFLAWFEKNSATGKLDEISTAKALEEFRIDSGCLKDLSFDTISGAGPNGAVVHYRVNERSNRKLEPGMLYLCDSGAQFEDGTTDITRTMAVGEVSDECKHRFTLVLKGNIAIATARFPKGTSGAQLEVLARIEMWRSGLDYDHGTGHGVGVYLSVHEGPHGISKLRNEPLVPGMIVSNEPGYYKEGAYGIRIENLELIQGLAEIEGGDRPMMEFETLTLAPIDRGLILPEQLTARELNWLNSYHAKVLEIVGPKLDSDTGNWLEEACSPL